MAQVKIYGLAEKLNPIKQLLSEIIHSCVMDALGMPADKRAQRFFPLVPEDFLMPGGRSDAYTIIEISLITGRSVATRKRLIRLLFDRINAQLGIDVMDIEICLYESPACNWGFRGLHGDEVTLNYDINV
ncbi:tautomerase family protein [Methylovulum psychrotolerans]|uniref:Tautomerase family protein n=1 Tax=Methylovulum psychrotolerans TaxID=1704499 RepID=A0A1Z4BTY2_9GAMM|nr:tautomerase family protein [Methylovulum psychrotolerans]ASF44693.1 tautomerase family protein [Methylovulum psychrotolerans]